MSRRTISCIEQPAIAVMPPAFDPYHQWLGIRPEEHPVDHYRLLGLVRFESDRDVIANACDRLMSHVRTFQTGPRGAHTQELLTRLAGARACLLDAHAKATYDAVLHGQMAAEAKQQAAAFAKRAAPVAAAHEPATAVLPPPPPMAPPVDVALMPRVRVEDQRPRQKAVRSPGQVESVDKPSPFYFQPWFPVMAVAGVLLVAVAVWGLGLMIGRAREKAADQLPVENQMTTSAGQSTDSQAREEEPPAVTVFILQEAGGELNFTAGTATLAGNPQLSELGGESVISGITSVDDRIRWSFRVEKPGPFRVEATYSAPAGSEGGTFTLAAGDQSTKPITVRNTGAPGEFTSERVGFLWVRRSGEHQLVLTPVSIVADQSLMTLKSLRLVPVGGGSG